MDWDLHCSYGLLGRFHGQVERVYVDLLFWD